MPNAMVVARLQWDSGSRLSGFKTLNNYLEVRLHQPALRISQQLLNSDLFERFFVALVKMMGDNRLLIAPFGDVFSEIWSLFPHQTTIDVLLAKDFSEPSHGRIFDLETDDDPRFEAIVSALSKSAAKGTLGSNPSELPNGGRPILSIPMLRSVEYSKWGTLKPVLIEELIAAYAKCPRNFWEIHSRQEPIDCLVRFLHELFIVYTHSIEDASLRWDLMQHQFKDYARSVQISLNTVLENNSSRPSEWYTELVQIDAGFPQVQDGHHWLTTLAHSLSSGDFATLKEIT